MRSARTGVRAERRRRVAARAFIRLGSVHRCRRAISILLDRVVMLFAGRHQEARASEALFSVENWPGLRKELGDTLVGALEFLGVINIHPVFPDRIESDRTLVRGRGLDIFRHVTRLAWNVSGDELGIQSVDAGVDVAAVNEFLVDSREEPVVASDDAVGNGDLMGADAQGGSRP